MGGSFGLVRHCSRHNPAMCGRFALTPPPAELITHFGLTSCPDFFPRYNISPTSDVLVIRHKPDTGRVGQMVRWGLVPSWAKDPSIGAKRRPPGIE